MSELKLEWGVIVPGRGVMGGSIGGECVAVIRQRLGSGLWVSSDGYVQGDWRVSAAEEEVHCLAQARALLGRVVAVRWVGCTEWQRGYVGDFIVAQVMRLLGEPWWIHVGYDVNSGTLEQARAHAERHADVMARRVVAELGNDGESTCASS